MSNSDCRCAFAAQCEPEMTKPGVLRATVSDVRLYDELLDTYPNTELAYENPR